MKLDYFIYYVGGIIHYIAVTSIATFIFLLYCKRKNNFALKFIASVFIVAALGVMLELPLYYAEIILSNALLAKAISFLLYLIVFFVWLFAVKFCYDESLTKVSVAAMLAALCQNLSYCVYSIVNITFNLDSTLYSRFAQGGYFIGQSIQTAIAAAVLAAAYLLFAKKIVGLSYLGEKDSGMFIVVVLTKIILSLFNSLESLLVSDDIASKLLVRSILLICTLCILALFVKILETKEVRNELEVINKLNRKEHEHFIKLKQDMELVNIKCHDIKHFIAAGSHSVADVKDLDEAVRIYDTTIKTGNEIIDTLLAERSLYCSANDIALTVMADASKLDFIGTPDMCALFGNLMENAIEATEKLTDGSRRFININIRPVAGQVFLCVENGYESTVKIVDGMPVSSKEKEKGFHGYGLKSIRMIAEKYDGVFAYKAEEGVFRVNILFPYNA